MASKVMNEKMQLLQQNYLELLLKSIKRILMIRIDCFMLHAQEQKTIYTLQNHKQGKRMTSKDIFKGTTYNSLEDQVGGKHYRSMKIQPAEFINENKLLFAEGNAIKYICRHQSKGKEEDIKKAMHYLEMILERDYS